MKKLFGTLLIIMSAIFIVGCGSDDSNQTGSEEGASAGSGDDTYTFELAHGGAVPSHFHEAATKLKELVEERSDERITINIHPNSELGGEREVTESVQTKSIDLAIVSSGPVGNFADKVYALDFPFLFSDRDHAHKVLDGQVGQDINEQLEEVNLKNLFWIENSTSAEFATNDKPIRALEDLKGLKIRTQENQIQQDTIKELGATPTPIAFDELFTAAQQGVVDGQFNGYPVLIPNNYYEVHDYISEVGLFYSPALMLMNNEAFMALPEDVQTILLESAEEAGIHQREYIHETNQELRQKAIDEGVEVIDGIDIEPFIEAVQPVYEKYEDKYGEIHQIIKDAQ